MRLDPIFPTGLKTLPQCLILLYRRSQIFGSVDVQERQAVRIVAGDLFRGQVADIGLGHPGIDPPLAFFQGGLYQRQAGRFAIDRVERLQPLAGARDDGIGGGSFEQFLLEGEQIGAGKGHIAGDDSHQGMMGGAQGGVEPAQGAAAGQQIGKARNLQEGVGFGLVCRH